MTSEAFAQTLAEAVGFIERALTRIEHDDDAEAALREMQAFLLDVMLLIERNPGIEAAANDLQLTAAVLVADRNQGASDVARRLRILRDSSRRFKERLANARPSERFGG
jgi:hypothetical protein